MFVKSAGKDSNAVETSKSPTEKQKMDIRILVECSFCGKILFSGTKKEARHLILYCTDCALKNRILHYVMGQSLYKGPFKARHKSGSPVHIDVFFEDDFSIENAPTANAELPPWKEMLRVIF